MTDKMSFTYTNPIVPDGYRCGVCGATGCKLWRKYATFLEHQSLFCAACAAKNQSTNHAHPVVSQRVRVSRTYEQSTGRTHISG